MRTLVAITGKIGSGKSTVGRILLQKGYPVIDCDEINAELLRDNDYLDALHALFPQSFPNGAFDKKALSKLVFSNENNRKTLNRIAHPIIFQRVSEQAQKYDGLVFCEIPILFGTGQEKTFDYIWVVRSDNDTLINRVGTRDHRDQEETRSILSSQNDLCPTDNAIIYIDNDGTLKELEQQVDQALCLIK